MQLSPAQCSLLLFLNPIPSIDWAILWKGHLCLHYCILFCRTEFCLSHNLNFSSKLIQPLLQYECEENVVPSLNSCSILIWIYKCKCSESDVVGCLQRWALCSSLVLVCGDALSLHHACVQLAYTTLKAQKQKEFAQCKAWYGQLLFIAYWTYRWEVVFLK